MNIIVNLSIFAKKMMGMTTEFKDGFPLEEK